MQAERITRDIIRCLSTLSPHKGDVIAVDYCFITSFRAHHAAYVFIKAQSITFEHYKDPLGHCRADSKLIYNYSINRVFRKYGRFTSQCNRTILLVNWRSFEQWFINWGELCSNYVKVTTQPKHTEHNKPTSVSSFHKFLTDTNNPQKTTLRRIRIFLW